MMESEELDNDPYDNRFFFAFFELNNKHMVEIMLIENYKNKKIRNIDYQFYYPKEELKTGKIHEYKFGNAKPNTREFSNEFFDWFDNLSPIKKLKENKKPILMEADQPRRSGVKNFYDKNLFNTREKGTTLHNQYLNIKHKTKFIRFNYEKNLPLNYFLSCIFIKSTRKH